ncbi:MAG TPA: helix-turn-helix transcriptional regulator [Symbiobacteriaceae bacterium]
MDTSRTDARRPHLIALASRLRQLRESLGLVQQDVADLFHTNRNVPSQWETGMREPSFEHLLVLADYYGVTTDWLLGREGAEMDGPHVRASKRELAAYLRSKEPSLKNKTPGYRLRLAVEFLAGKDPQMFSLSRIARRLLISEETLRHMCFEQAIPTSPVIQRFAHFANLPELWFYQPEPQLEDPAVKYRALVERLHAEGTTPEAAEQKLWGARRGGRRAKGDGEK